MPQDEKTSAQPSSIMMISRMAEAVRKHAAPSANASEQEWRNWAQDEEALLVRGSLSSSAYCSNVCAGLQNQYNGYLCGASMPPDLQDIVNQRLSALDTAAANASWGDWYVAPVTGASQRSSVEGQTSVQPERNVAVPPVFVPEENAVRSLKPSSFTAPEPPSRQATPGCIVSPSSVDSRSSADRETNAAEGTIIHRRPSLVPKQFPQNLSQLEWEKELSSKEQVAAWHQAQKEQQGVQVRCLPFPLFSLISCCSAGGASFARNIAQYHETRPTGSVSPASNPGKLVRSHRT